MFEQTGPTWPNPYSDEKLRASEKRLKDAIEANFQNQQARVRKSYGILRLLGSLLVGLVAIPLCMIAVPLMYLIAFGEVIRDSLSRIFRE